MAVGHTKAKHPVGSLLRTLRTNRQLSVTALATAMECDKALISRFERGEGSLGRNVAKRLHTFFEGEITRDQILFPEDYAKDGGRKPPTSQQVLHG